MSIEQRLQALQITLPPVAKPAAAYVPFVQTGSLVFISGHIARRDGKPWVGQLGRTMTTTEGQQAARAIAVDLMGTRPEAEDSGKRYLSGPDATVAVRLAYARRLAEKSRMVEAAEQFLAALRARHQQRVEIAANEFQRPPAEHAFDRRIDEFEHA